MCRKTRSSRRFRESCDGPNQNCSVLEQFHPRGVMMRDCLKNRAGYDRVLMAVAATFLTVSATSALAQNDPPRNSAAELAIDQGGKSKRRAVFQIRADDLHADRETTVG